MAWPATAIHNSRDRQWQKAEKGDVMNICRKDEQIKGSSDPKSIFTALTAWCLRKGRDGAGWGGREQEVSITKQP